MRHRKFTCLLFLTILSFAQAAEGIIPPPKMQLPREPDKDDIPKDKAIAAARGVCDAFALNPTGTPRVRLVEFRMDLCRAWEVSYDNACVKIESRKGQPVGARFSRPPLPAELAKKKKDSAIPEAEAKRIALQAAEKIGLALDADKVTCDYQDLWEMEKGDLLGAIWVVYQPTEANGIKAFGSATFFSVRAADGAIEALSLPHSLSGLTKDDVKITQEEALRRAREKAQPEVRDQVDKGELLAVNPFMFRIPAEKLEPILCWVFRAGAEGQPASIIFVNAVDGAVYVR